MKINDRVYGEFEVTEPVLLKLIESKPVQRLKGVNQAGPSKYVFPIKSVTRYEHSIGVMILLKKMGASIEEQIAGLLHDVPHTAFSHVADFIFRSEEHEFHERFHKEVIMNSEIPEILKEFSLDVDRILDEHNFTLLEKSLPDLCADRLDYTFRDMIVLLKYKEEMKEYLESLTVVENEIVFDDPKIARKFAEDYLKIDHLSWSSQMDVTVYHLLAKAINIAMEEGVLTEQELFEDDEYVYSKLRKSTNPEIKHVIEMINPNLKIEENEEDYDFHDKGKVRYINPKIKNNGRVGEVYPEFLEVLDEHAKKTKKGHHIKILSY